MVSRCMQALSGVPHSSIRARWPVGALAIQPFPRKSTSLGVPALRWSSATPRLLFSNFTSTSILYSFLAHLFLRLTYRFEGIFERLLSHGHHIIAQELPQRLLGVGARFALMTARPANNETPAGHEQPGRYVPVHSHEVRSVTAGSESRRTSYLAECV